MLLASQFISVMPRLWDGGDLLRGPAEVRRQTMLDV